VPDPVHLATGVLMERYRQDLQAASATLRELAEGSGQQVHRYAAVLVTTPPDPAGDTTAAREPAVIRRAVEFIDSNAHRSIDLAEIAEASLIGARGLQASFRKHRDQTPLGYLREVRMQRAHRDLLAADPAAGDTVAEIAARWGFAHPGRFSVSYREAFGVSPGVTLRH
jgi:transcriptional regulator GlxA family with amidase domain